MKGNYKYCNPCCWCANREETETGRSYCVFQNDYVGGLNTCDKWEEFFEEEN